MSETTEEITTAVESDEAELPTPPWGEDFDPERAWHTITSLREREKELARNQLTDSHREQLAEWHMLQEISQSETERAQNAAAAAQSQLEKLRTRAVEAEVKAQAADFVKPEAALRFLDVSKYATADGDIDTDAIKADLAELLTTEPYLRRADGVRAPAPNPAQGSSASGVAAPTQLSQEDVKRLYRERKYAEIETARLEGRLKSVLGG